MKRSEQRILTTHAGSLPRPADLLAMMRAREHGETVDEGAFAERVRRAVAEVVGAQIAHGLDVIDDGEMGKPSFLTYVVERLGGFEPIEDGAPPDPWEGSREVASFPEFYAQEARRRDSGPSTRRVHMRCVAPLTYTGHARLRADIETLEAATADAAAGDVFMPAISPTNIEAYHRNEHYASQEDYLFAIADAMHEEYRAIVDAGFLVQIDDPRLVTYYVMNPDLGVADCRKWAEARVEALNHALRGIPEDRVRYHTCYSINMGPRVHDMELKDIVDIILGIRAGAYSFEAANPRHEHEWRVWRDVDLPEGKTLIPGVITHSSVLVEHPELVAERLVRFASVVGRENVIAGADCGFATFASTTPEIHPSIVWAKLEALAEGARLATGELWGRG